MPIAVRLLPCALLTTVVACKPDCPEGATDRRGYNCTPIPGSTTEPEVTTTTTDASSTGEETSTTSTQTLTTEPEPCDDDPACGPGEDVETCPEQCSVCGDGHASGTEACDNGPANQTYWPLMPPEGACSEHCTSSLQWCGDGEPNGAEACDNGDNSDAAYTALMPGPSACAAGCVLPGYCGDGTLNGDEPCDEAAQTATCEAACTTPACGDGTLNPLAGEACDDANQTDGDGCSADCKAIERFVFVTSVPFIGDFKPRQENPEALSGLALADFRCQDLAVKAGLPGNYKAWLSTVDASPLTRFDTGFIGLFRLKSDGAPVVAMGWQGLVSGTLLHPIDAVETGAMVQDPKNVWTNTLPDATKASDQDCAGWTTNNNTKTTFGQSTAIDSMWTKVDTTQCSNALRLYCFQDA